jgi:WD40 repeat protein
VLVADGKFGDSLTPPRLLAWTLADGTPRSIIDDALLLRTMLRAPIMARRWNRVLPSEFLDTPAARAVLPGVSRDRLSLAPGTSLHGVTLSPDGGRLAYYINETQRRYAVHVVTLGESAARVHSRFESAGNLRLLFSPDGRTLAVGDGSAELALRDADSGALRLTLRGHADTPMGMDFSPDGRRMVTGGWDAVVRLWNLDDGECLALARGHVHSIDTVAFSRDGTRVASGGRDGTLRIWDAAELEPLAVHHGHRSDVVSIAFLPGDQQLLTTGRDGTVRLWDVRPATQHRDVLRGHTSYVYPVAFHPTQPLIVSGGWDGVLRLWDARDGAPLGALADDGLSYLQHIAFNADGSRMLSLSSDRRLRLWDPAERRVLASAPAGPPWWMPRFARDGRVLVARRDAESLLWWTPDSDRTKPLPLASIRDVGPPLVSPDGRYAMLGPPEDGQRAELYDLAAGRSLRELSDGCERFAQRNILGAFSPDGRFWLAARNDHAIAVLDLSRGAFVGELRGHADQVFCIVWSPDGRRIASGGRDGVIRIWDGATFEELAQLRGHSSYIWALAWSPNGETLASSSGDHTVRLWRGAAPAP